MSTGLPQVLIITGPVGSGKTSVALEAAEILHSHGSHHGAVDLDALRWCWPQPQDDEFGVDLGLRNLRHVWNEYEAMGIRRLLIADVIESRDELDDFRTALPKATFQIARLTVNQEVLQERLHIRETGTALDWNLNRAAELTRSMNTNKVEDFVIDNSDRTLHDVARDLLTTSGWIPDSL